MVLFQLTNLQLMTLEYFLDLIGIIQEEKKIRYERESIVAKIAVE